MKIKDAINMANLMEQGNVLPKELAILFLSELDGMIQSDIMLHAPEEIVSYDNEEQELLLRPPHDKLYIHYLVMMIRNQQQEYEGYQNTQAAVDEKLKTFRRWYVQHYRPADTDSRSYTGGTSADAFGFAYLTAYGLAVRNGYQGTEEQWLESLHGATGDPGAPARMRYDEQRETIQWGVGEVWYDLFGLQALRDPAVDAFLREAGSVADAAGQSAAAAGNSEAAASNSEAAARGHAKTAADAAADALALAGQANQSAQNAEAAARSADASSEQGWAWKEAAKNAAQEAAQHEQKTRDYVEGAEQAAGAAEDAALQAEEILTQAQAAAEATSGSEAAARGHAETAADAADDALASAGQAKEQAERAGAVALGASDEASRAAGSAHKAAAAQTAAENAAADALGYAEDAETQAVAAARSAMDAQGCLHEAEDAAQNAEAAAEQLKSELPGAVAAQIQAFEQGHDLELITSFKLTEAVSSLDITADADGDPFELETAVIELHTGTDGSCGEGSSGATQINYGTATNPYQLRLATSNTGFPYHGYQLGEGKYRDSGFTAYATIRNNLGICGGFSGDFGSFGTHMLTMRNYRYLDSPISRINVLGNLPVNAAISVYGTRRDSNA